MAESDVDNLQTQNLLSPIFKELETILGKDTFDMWIRPAVFEITDHTVSIQLPNTVWQRTIQTRYENIIKDAFLKHTGLEVTVEYIIKETQDLSSSVLEETKKILVEMQDKLNKGIELSAEEKRIWKLFFDLDCAAAEMACALLKGAYMVGVEDRDRMLR